MAPRLPIVVRSRLFAIRARASDRRRRLLHAARHRLPGRPRDGNAIFNLDLHVSVVADVRTELERRGIGMTSWSISGHTWVFGRERDPVAVVNERTGPQLGDRMVRRFQRVYGSYLRSFRGFVATYPPGFALLYEGLGRPTLAVAATRYEWPFTFDPERWAWLDAGLKRGVEEGWLHVAANNRADADYLSSYTGLDVPHLPSACDYLHVSYTGRRRAAVICAKRDDVAASMCRQLKHDAVPLRGALGKRYEWADLYDHRAIVLIPYNVSLMSLFEHYSACAPIYVPARGFLKELMAEHPHTVLAQLSYAQESTAPAAAASRDVRDLNDVRDPGVVDWFLDRADFYDADWMPRIRQFESWSHLDHLLSTDDHAAISAEMAEEKPDRLRRISERWDELAWLRELCGDGTAPVGRPRRLEAAPRP